MFQSCISFHKILILSFIFLFQLLLLYLHEVLFHLHDSCALCIHTILRSYWMSWDPHLSCWILENSQIAWILELALLPLFFMWSIQHLIMCHQSSLVFLLLTRKFNKIFCKFQERKDLPGFQNFIYSGAHLKNLFCAPLWNVFYPVLVLVWMQTFSSLMYAFSLVLRILNTFVPILIFQILLSCNCYK